MPSYNMISGQFPELNKCLKPDCICSDLRSLLKLQAGFYEKYDFEIRAYAVWCCAVFSTVRGDLETACI